jgi:hypothetical protein
MVQKMCTHVCKHKSDPIETTPESGNVGLKENGRRSEFMYDIFDTL